MNKEQKDAYNTWSLTMYVFFVLWILIIALLVYSAN